MRLPLRPLFSSCRPRVQVRWCTAAGRQPEYITKYKTKQFNWTEISGFGDGKTIEEFSKEALRVLKEINVPGSMLRECCAKYRLPTYAHRGNHTLIVVRVPVDEITLENKAQKWSISELSDRVTIVTHGNDVYLFHARELPLLSKLQQSFVQDFPIDRFIWFVLQELVGDASKSLAVTRTNFDAIESRLVEATQQGVSQRGITKSIYAIMRRCSVDKRIQMETIDMLHTLSADPPSWAQGCAKDPQYKLVVEKASHFLTYTDELHSSARDLLEMHFGTAAHRTNDMVRLLTLLNAIFVPLSFVAGFFGMNHEYLPGVGEICGVQGVWFLMIGMVFMISGLLFWFDRSGWLSVRVPRL